MKKRYLINIIILIVLFVLQSTLLRYIKILGIKPDLMLIYVIGTAFINGEYEGTFYGALCGLMQDCLFAEFIGINLFLYAISGFVAGMLSRGFYRENIIIPIVSVFLITLSFNFLYYVLFVLLKGNTHLLYYIKTIFVPSAIYNCVFTLPIYAVAYYFNEYLGISGLSKRRMF